MSLALPRWADRGGGTALCHCCCRSLPLAAREGVGWAAPHDVQTL